MLQPAPGRVRQPATYPAERVLIGELHLLRSRLDELLGRIASVVVAAERDEEWLRVEQGARLSRRAIAAAVAATPSLPLSAPGAGELRVGRLRVDTLARRAWYGDSEFELTPLHHQLLATMATDPCRVFGKDELLAAVWGRNRTNTNAVNTSVSRVRRALVAAGAPQGSYMFSLHGVGWSLTKPGRPDH